MIWKMKKDKDNNNTYTLPTGAKITIETDRKLIKKNVEKKKGKSKKNAVNLKDILEKQRGLSDELFIGGVDVTKLEWDDFFTEEVTNPIFFKAFDKDSKMRLFLPGEEEYEGQIGMWIGVTDEETNKSFGRFIYKDCVGTLLVIMFVLINCTKLRDKRDHRFSVATMRGVNPVYEHFRTRILTEATAQTKAYFAYLGGVVESVCRAKATSPEKIIKMVDKYIQG